MVKIRCLVINVMILMLLLFKLLHKSSPETNEEKTDAKRSMEMYMEDRTVCILFIDTFKENIIIV